jgi:hypothetical protein
MKAIKILYLLIILTNLGYGQTGVNPCNRNISTNPDNPINDEWGSLFPGLTPTPYFTNTFFDWSIDAPNIQIDQTQNWDDPYSAQSGVINMINPFDNDNGFGTAYLHVGDPLLRDWHWEDGWELLYMNLGFYPNGAKTDINGDPNHWRNSGYKVDPTPDNAPYFILYNRYKGILRVFANVWFEEYDVSQENITIELRLQGAAPEITDEPVYSGVFRLGEGLDRPLDQPTEIVSLKSPRNHPSGSFPGSVAVNTNQWVGADFQVAYDPCQCNIPTRFWVVFGVRKELNVDLTLRTISYDRDLNDLADQEQNFFQSMVDANGNVVAPGNVAYAGIKDLLEDYKKALEKYNDDLNDYNSLGNQGKILLMTLLDYGLGKGSKEIVDQFSKLSLAQQEAVEETIEENQIETNGEESSDEGSGEETEEEKKESEFAKEVTKAGKKLLANQFEFMNVILGVSKKPVKPQVPQATFTEGRIAGTITDTNTFASVALLMPGTGKLAGWSDLSISPLNYPAYNNVLGMFAVMETPEIKLYNGSIYDYQSDYVVIPDQYVNGKMVDRIVRTKQDFFLSIEDIQYALNEALDWDMSKSSFLVGLEIEFVNDFLSRDMEAFKTELHSNSNFTINHFFRTPISVPRTKLTLVANSEYYKIQDIKNKLFHVSLVNEMPWTGKEMTWLFGSDWHRGVEEPFLIENNQFQIKSIKMKVIADMYFDQIAYPTDPTNENYTGAQVNTFQVRTFELYNKDKAGSLEEQLRGEIVEEYQSWANYLPGTTVLTGEIAHDDTRVIEIDNSGSTPTLIIRAEHVEVTGEVKPENGYDLRIEAMTEIKVMEGGKLLPNVTATIVPDFYGNGPNPPATRAEVDAFCTGANPVYGANNPGKRAQEIIAANERERQLREQRATLNLNVYPNPASVFVQVAVQNQPQQITDVQLVLSDLTGRQILAEEQTANPSGRYVLNLPELATGVYMLQVTAGDKTAVEKIVVQ